MTALSDIYPARSCGLISSLAKAARLRVERPGVGDGPEPPPM